MVRHDDECRVLPDGFAHPPQPAVQHLVKFRDAVLQHVVLHVAGMLGIHEVPEHVTALIDGPEIDEEEILVLMLEQIIQRTRALLIDENHLIPELARREHAVVEPLGLLWNAVRENGQ